MTTLKLSSSSPSIVDGAPTRLWPLVSKFLISALLILFLLGELYPIFWLLVSSLKESSEFNLRPIYALPDGIHWQNYVTAWDAGMGRYFSNSVLATFPALFLTIVLGSAAAFGIEVMRWRFGKAVLLVFLTGIMVPVQIVILPLFTIFLKIGLLNSLYGLIIVYTAFGLPLTVFMMSGFFKNLPREVIEAAIVDGASIYTVFRRIALPMVKNSIVTVALVQFFFIWNDLLLSMTFVSKTDVKTIQTGLLSFVGRYGVVDWGPTFAGISMAVIPTLIIYLFMNRTVIKGLTSGAVKG